MLFRSYIMLGSLLLVGGARLAAQPAWTFTRTNLPGVTGINSIAFGNGRFVISLGSNPATSPTAAWSVDGVTWTGAVAGPHSEGWVLFTAGTFYIGAAGQVFRSADGANWIRIHDTPTNRAGPVQLASNGSALLAAITTPSGQLVYSADRVDFNPTAPLPGVTAGSLVFVDNLTYGAGRFFVGYTVGVGSALVRRLVSTVDGRDWATVPFLVESGKMAGGNARVIGITPALRSMITFDGQAFSSFPVSLEVVGGVRLAYAGGRFIMSRSFMASSDGVTWGRIGLGGPADTTNLRDIAYGNGRYVAVGQDFPRTATAGTDVVAYLQAATPPLITTFTPSTVAVEGRPVRLVASISNPDTTTTFQWFRNGAVIGGATLPELFFPALTAADSGRYQVRVRNSLGTVMTEPSLLTFVPIAQAGRIANLSVLTSLSSPAAYVTVGFVVAGTTAGATKPLLVRAGGPSLARFGVVNPHPDPALELYAGQTQIAVNDDWSGAADLAAAMSRVGAFPFTSADSKDAAIFNGAVPLGDNSVRITGRGAGVGAVIAELYDATPVEAITLATPRLANVSVLHELPAGSTLSAGFVITGTSSVTVVVRAVGPSLGKFGLSRTLVDPALMVFAQQAASSLAGNDDWADDPELAAAFSRVGAFALSPGSRDAALLLTLPPGAYVAQASGRGDGAGSLLVEVYEVR